MKRSGRLVLGVCLTVLILFVQNAICLVDDNEIADTRGPEPNGCKCENYSCSCCSHMEAHRIDLNATVCANFAYLVHDYGISYSLTWNDRAIYNKTISARNPPPMCVGSPFVKELAEICLRFEDLDFSEHSLSGCIEAEAEFKSIVIAKYKLGCFNIGPKQQREPEQISVIAL